MDTTMVSRIKISNLLHNYKKKRNYHYILKYHKISNNYKKYEIIIILNTKQ